ncbi:MAG: VanZ family protein [Bacilli bacterium]|nr:VanZ family protein [Bacilli bacterium]
MFGPLSNTIQGVVNLTWPMIIISIIIIVSTRLTYLLKNHEKLVLYKELLMLSFIIYILCLFQVVTYQDEVSWATNNFIPLKEIFRYDIGSRLFFKNVLGNMVMFLPFGFFISYYLKSDDFKAPLFLTIIASISIEEVQMLIGRVFDVDDILLNILGGLIGYFLYHILSNIGHNLPKVFKSEIFLNIISILILIGLFMIIL